MEEMAYKHSNIRTQNIQNVKESDIFLLQILNALERLGYRVVTSSSIVTGFGKHDTKWVLIIIKFGPLYSIS